MSLLTICQSAADDTKGERPISIVGNTEPDAQMLLRLVYKVGLDLRRAIPWQVLRKEKTFTAIAGDEQTSILPSDFDRFMPETFWNRTDIFLVSGPVSPTEWAGMKANNYNDEARKFIHRGNSVFVVPDFDGGESLAFEYISKNWIDTDADGLGDATVWAADTDTSAIDEELLTLGVTYEYRKAQGAPSDRARADYIAARKALIRNDQPAAGILTAGDIWGGGRHFTGAPPVNGDSSVI